MTTSSRIFPVLSALYTAYDAVSADLLIVRGEPTKPPSKDFLAVGWTPLDQTAINGEQTRDGDTRYSPLKETFTVSNYLQTHTGSTSEQAVVAREQRLFDYWQQIQDLHNDNPELAAGVLGTGSGSAGSTEIANFQFIPDQNPFGFVAGLVFHIYVESWRN